MARSINDHSSGDGTFDRVISKAGSLHGVDELERKGIERVRVLNASKLQGLVRVALNRVMRSALKDIEMTPEARATIRDRAQEEFERLLSEGVEVQTSPNAESVLRDNPSWSPDAPEGVRDFLTRENEALRELADERSAPPAFDISPISEEYRSFEDRMVQNISTLLERDWREELREVETSHRHQLELLERRISQLVRALESTDRVLAHLQERPAGTGLAAAGSVTEISPLSEKKSQLLKALLQANLELRELHHDEE